MLAQKKLLIAAGVFASGLLLGLIIFFPLQRIKNTLVSQLSKQSGMDIEISKLSFGTGLGLGLSKGSLLAIHIEQLNVIDRSGKSIRCHHFVIAPHLISLLRLHLTLGISCDLDPIDRKVKELGSLKAVVSLMPLYKPSKASAEVEFTNLNLPNLIDFAGARLPTKIEMNGSLNGTFEISDLSLLPSGGVNPSASFDLKFEKLLLSDLEIQNAPLFSLPLNLGSTVVKGSLEQSKLVLSKLDFLSDELSGSMEMNFTLGKGGMLQEGFWKGKVKALATNPDRELSYLLESNFGIIDPSGFREFTKKFDNGNFMALMGKPSE